MAAAKNFEAEHDELFFVTGAEIYLNAPAKLKFLTPFVVTKLGDPTKVPLFPFPLSSFAFPLNGHQPTSPLAGT